MATILARLTRYKKQKRLLRRRAGDFIARDIEEIEELERLEDNERQTREEQETLLKQHEEAAADAQQLAAVSDDPSLTQKLNSPSGRILISLLLRSRNTFSLPLKVGPSPLCLL